MRFVIPGLLSKLFNKPCTPSLDTFLQNYEELNRRDAKQDVAEMRERIITKLDPKFKTYIQGCEDYHLLSELTYVITMYTPPITSYQKIRARTILAELLLERDDSKRNEVISYFIKSMQLDE